VSRSGHELREESLEMGGGAGWGMGVDRGGEERREGGEEGERRRAGRPYGTTGRFMYQRERERGGMLPASSGLCFFLYI